ncbi:unnamed protein product, partial [Ectocarpus fasciculatus]
TAVAAAGGEVLSSSAGDSASVAATPAQALVTGLVGSPVEAVGSGADVVVEAASSGSDGGGVVDGSVADTTSTPNEEPPPQQQQQ